MRAQRGHHLGPRWRRADDRGSAALEFALLLPIFLVIVFGIFDFGMLMYAQTVVNNAVREGARTASLGGTLDESVAATRAAVGTLPGVTTTVTTACTVPSTGATCPNWVTGASGKGAPSEAVVKVTATYTYRWLTPVPSFIPGLGDSRNVSTASSMVVE